MREAGFVGCAVLGRETGDLDYLLQAPHLPTAPPCISRPRRANVSRIARGGTAEVF